VGLNNCNGKYITLRKRMCCGKSKQGHLFSLHVFEERIYVSDIIVGQFFFSSILEIQVLKKTHTTILGAQYISDSVYR